MIKFQSNNFDSPDRQFVDIKSTLSLCQKHKNNRELISYDKYSEIPYEWYVKLRLAEQPTDINRDNSNNHGNNMTEYVMNIIRLSKRTVDMPNKQLSLV